MDDGVNTHDDPVNGVDPLGTADECTGTHIAAACGHFNNTSSADSSGDKTNTTAPYVPPVERAVSDEHGNSSGDSESADLGDFELLADANSMESRRGHRGHQGQGERRRAGKPSGTPTPGKHVKPSSTHPGRWEVRDPHTGNWILKPPGWMPTELDVIKSAVTIGTGYIIWRAIRMIPSLFPPFWATVPENVLIP